MNPTDIPIDALKDLTDRIHSQEYLLAFSIILLTAFVGIFGFWLCYKIITKRDDVLSDKLEKLTVVLTKIVSVQELDHDSMVNNRELIGQILGVLGKIDICVSTISSTLQNHMDACRDQYDRLMGRK